MKIKIEWLDDASDCETCGYSYAEGAKVSIDGVDLLEFTPIASCCDSVSFSREDVLLEILSHLGHEVEIT